jgi:hypothetical protein
MVAFFATMRSDTFKGLATQYTVTCFQLFFIEGDGVQSDAFIQKKKHPVRVPQFMYILDCHNRIQNVPLIQEAFLLTQVDIALFLPYLHLLKTDLNFDP